MESLQKYVIDHHQKQLLNVQMKNCTLLCLITPSKQVPKRKLNTGKKKFTISQLSS